MNHTTSRTPSRRRRATAVVGMAVTALLLAGCSGDGDDGSTPTGAGATSSGGTTTGGGATAAPTGSGTAAPSATATAAPTTSGPAAQGPSSQPTGPVNGSQASVLDTLPGSAGAGCQTVAASARDVRAGSVAVGNFQTARTEFAKAAGGPDPQVGLYVIPGDANATSARVSVKPVSGGSAAQFSSVAKEQAAEWSYFPVRVGVPAAGSYRIDVTAGSSKGCYVVSFSKG